MFFIRPTADTPWVLAGTGSHIRVRECALYAFVRTRCLLTSMASTTLYAATESMIDKPPIFEIDSLKPERELSSPRERDVRNANFVFFGGSTGIGRAAALELGRRGACVLIVGRGHAAGKSRAWAPPQPISSLGICLLPQA